MSPNILMPPGLDTLDLSLDLYPTLAAMEAHPAFIKIVIGPAGSAKTTCAIKSLFTRSLLQEPAPDGVRYTKWLILRQTVRQLRLNTIPSIKKSIGEGYWPIVEHPTPKIHAYFPLPDGTFVDCVVEFLGMDARNAMKDLLGGEYTGAFLDEVSELADGYVGAVFERCGRYPAERLGTPTWVGVLGATNGPRKGHWLEDWAMNPKPEWKVTEKEKGRPYFQLFCQPPALLRPTEPGGDWLPNPAAENIHNLDEGYSYYLNRFISSGLDARITAYVEGKFATLVAGTVVFPEFSEALHVVPRDSIEIVPGAPLLAAFDFGRTPVCLLAVVTKNGTLIVIEEFYLEKGAISTLYENEIKPRLESDFRKNQIEYAWGDPAGDVPGQGTEDSPFSVLQDNDVPVEVNWGTGNALFPRLEAVRKRLVTLSADKTPKLLIADNCVMTLSAIQENYIYEEDTKGSLKEVPTKTHDRWCSDLMDALQYLCLGYSVETGETQRRGDKRDLESRKRIREKKEL